MSSIAPPGRRIGEILMDAQVLGAAPLAEALDRQRGSGLRLGAVLVEMGVLDQHAVIAALGTQFGLPVADLRRHPPEPDAVRAVPKELASRLTAIPVRRVAAGLEVAVADPLHDSLMPELERAAGGDVQLLVAAPDDIRDAIDNCYGPSSPRRAGRRTAARPASPDEVDVLLTEALGDGATAVHLDVTSGRVRLRRRVDGAMQADRTLPLSAGHALVRHLENRAGMAAAPFRRAARRGRFERTIHGRPVEVDVAVAATATGQSLVARLFERERRPPDLGHLGLPPDVHQRLAELLRRQSGLLVVAGPSRSGVSTTLYAALAEASSPVRSLATIDDPPAFVVPEVAQLQFGASAAEGIRAALNHDPDVLLVGNIDEPDAARAAAQAALGGLLVIAGLHAPGAAVARPRLHEMGLEPYLVSAAVRAVLGQRLLRRICPACRTPYRPSPGELAYWGTAPEPAEFVRGQGCQACSGAGYAGRVGVFELLVLPEEVWADGGSFAEQAARLVGDGITDLSEAMRVVNEVA